MIDEPDFTADFPQLRTLRPRRRGRYFPLALYVVNGDIVTTEDGEMFPTDDYIFKLGLLDVPERALAIGVNVGAYIAKIHKRMKMDNNVQWQARLSEKASHTGDWVCPRTGNRIPPNTFAVFSHFGYKRRYKSGYHLKHFPIDPLLFSPSTYHKPPATDTASLLEWGKSLRAFMAKNDLAPTPTHAGLAGQLLKDRRFWPNARRKVPSMTNKKVRPLLIGNHEWIQDRSVSHLPKLLELDQVRSHHSCATDLVFPSSNSLYAAGNFLYLSQGKPFAYPNTKSYEAIMADHGAIYCAVKRRSHSLPAIHTLHELPENETSLVWLTSNEYPYLAAMGITIEYIIATWTAWEPDTGLNKYAQWAMQQLDNAAPNEGAMLKPMLLSAYGILAAKPRPLDAGYLRSEHGKGVEKPHLIGQDGATLYAWHFGGDYPYEPNTANVVWRAMIERESLMRTCALAYDLIRKGHTVWRVSADALYITPSKGIPAYDPARWKLKELTNCYTEGNKLVSDQVQLLPGLCGPRRVAYIEGMHNGTVTEVPNAAQRERTERPVLF